MRVVVYGLWHLGSVTAACLAEAGHEVVGLDVDERTVRDLQQGQPPLHEPGLDELVRSGLDNGRLRFTTGAAMALRDAEALWVTFDTPIDDDDVADVRSVRRRLDLVRDSIASGTLVVISSQVPVGFTRALLEDWGIPGLRVACLPENLRLGQALDSFRRPSRVVVGLRDPADRESVATLLRPLDVHVEWMSLESAEMTKHALNAFLATSVTFINEVARLCEVTGADAKEVERGLRGDERVGPRAYVAPGAPFAGGTLARDVRYLREMGQRHEVATPLLEGVGTSNAAHRARVRRVLLGLLDAVPDPTVAVLGLAYKPGTSTLRRSESIELCDWLTGRGARVRVHDPAIPERPVELPPLVEHCRSVSGALGGADLAVVATPWPDYRALTADAAVALMRHPTIVDPHWLLTETLGSDARITYVAVGRRERRE